MEKFFKVKEHGSTVRVEVLAGITTFMAMSYILMVNAGMFSALPEVSYNAIYIATALSAVVGTFARASDNIAFSKLGTCPFSSSISPLEHAP